MLSAAGAIIVATALFVFTWEKRQRLGNPGVRVVDVPMQCIEVSATATNRFVVASNSVYLPEEVLSYASYSSPIAKLVWDWLPKDTTYGQRIYSDTNGFRIQTMAVLMGKDRTSIHQPQYCLTGAGWRSVSQEQIVIPIEATTPFELPAVKMKLRKAYRGPDKREREIAAVLVYWFVAENQLTADHRQRMWWMARDLLRRGVLQRWAYITQFSVCEPGQEEATFDRIREFIRASVPHYQAGPGLAQSPGSDGGRAPSAAAIRPDMPFQLSASALPVH